MIPAPNSWTFSGGMSSDRPLPSLIDSFRGSSAICGHAGKRSSLIRTETSLSLSADGTMIANDCTRDAGIILCRVGCFVGASGLWMGGVDPLWLPDGSSTTICDSVGIDKSAFGGVSTSDELGCGIVGCFVGVRHPLLTNMDGGLMWYSSFSLAAHPSPYLLDAIYQVVCPAVAHPWISRWVGLVWSSAA